jgi:hypothetical protein
MANRIQVKTEELRSDIVRQQPPFRRGVFGGIGTIAKSEIP